MVSKSSNDGFTFVEILVSVTLLGIIFLGTVQYFTVSRWEIEKGIRTQMAWTSITSHLERAILLDYDSLQVSLTETSVPLLVNNIQGYRTTVITPIDDGLDGLSPVDTDIPDYLKISVYFAWFTPENITDSTSIFFSPQRSWSN